jgi:hypothetical protein
MARPEATYRGMPRKHEPALYVIGEEGLDTPVKIGISIGSRAELQCGNWRPLEVLLRRPLAWPDLRWTEWRVHQALRRRRGEPWVLGEWFRVRPHAEALGSWDALIDAALANNVPGVEPAEPTFPMVGGHRVLSVRCVSSPTPRPWIFRVECECGFAHESATVKAARRFTLEHLVPLGAPMPAEASRPVPMTRRRQRDALPQKRGLKR